MLPEWLSGHSYVFLLDVLPDFLDDMLLAAIRGLWFQEDGNTADTLDICLYKNTAVDGSNKVFFLVPDVTLYFIFLENYRSHRYSSLGIFYVLPTSNLAVQSLGYIFETPCIYIYISMCVRVLTIIIINIKKLCKSKIR